MWPVETVWVGQKIRKVFISTREAEDGVVFTLHHHDISRVFMDSLVGRDRVGAKWSGKSVVESRIVLAGGLLFVILVDSRCHGR